MDSSFFSTQISTTDVAQQRGVTLLECLHSFKKRVPVSWGIKGASGIFR
jgi:hypothetical protein